MKRRREVGDVRLWTSKDARIFKTWFCLSTDDSSDEESSDEEVATQRQEKVVAEVKREVANICILLLCLSSCCLKDFLTFNCTNLF